MNAVSYCLHVTKTKAARETIGITETTKNLTSSVTLTHSIKTFSPTLSGAAEGDTNERTGIYH